MFGEGLFFHFIQFSILRLSYVVFGLGIMLLWLADWKKKRSRKRLVAYLAFAIAFQLLWICGLVLSEGSLTGFIEMSLAFVSGHFNEWGGTSTFSPTDLWHRAIKLIFDNILWTGLFGHSALVAVLMGLLIAIAVAVAARKRKLGFHPESFDIWLIALCLAYILWVLFAQNIDKPRHIAPLLGPVVYLIFLFAFKQNRGGWTYRLQLALVVFLIGAQTVHGMVLAKKQAADIPAVYQLAMKLEEMHGPFIVYTWEETRVMQYLRTSYEHRRVLTYEYFLQEVSSRNDQRILLTNRVLEGFALQGADVAGRVKKLDEFHSEPLFDPVYDEIVLYEWIK